MPLATWLRGEAAQEFELLLANRGTLLAKIQEYSPIEWVSRDDPPLYLDYTLAVPPADLGKPQADPTHSAINGIMLAGRMHEAGLEAVVSLEAAGVEPEGRKLDHVWRQRLAKTTS